MKDEECQNLLNAAFIQKDQLLNAERVIVQANESLKKMNQSNSEQSQALDHLIQIAESISDGQCDSYSLDTHEKKIDHLINNLQQNDYNEDVSLPHIDTFSTGNDPEEYFKNMEAYAIQHNIDLTQNYLHELLTPAEILDIETKIKEEYTLTKPHCDKYDYLIASVCGALGGLIDVIFVGIPGDSILGGLTDEAANSLVEKFAGIFGWPGAKDGANSTKSAIGFLERKFKVNYDQTTSEQLNNKTRMIPKNHHLKSLGHSPDIVGLFFSILNQFTNTASFISDGRIITIDTKTFELHGGNFFAKIFSGFVNWLGHIFSDMAGSSGGVGRGSGVPIPFYNLFLLMNFGSFGEKKLTFSRLAVKVFEQGYDLRHGVAMAIPVAFSELSIRLMWSVKQIYYHNKSFKQSIPFGSIPELRRMLLVGHGVCCFIDGTDAAIRSKGSWVNFFLRTNLIAWVRFGHLSLNELRIYIVKDVIDTEQLDKDLDKELIALLR